MLRSGGVGEMSLNEMFFFNTMKIELFEEVRGTFP
jgi:hypothetical protein